MHVCVSFYDLVCLCVSVSVCADDRWLYFFTFSLGVMMNEWEILTWLLQGLYVAA